MKKLFVLIFVMLNHIGLTSGQTWNDQNYDSKIDPELQEEMSQKNSTPENMFPIIVMMSEQYDLAEMNRKTQFMDKQTKREFVINEMKRFTSELQADVALMVNERSNSNSIKDFQQFWLFNGFYCKATKEMIEAFASRKDIAMIYSDKERQMFPKDWNPLPVENNRGTTAWNVEKVNADDVWESGYTGKGVVVAILDTGVNYNHNDIKNNMWDGGSAYPHHGYDVYNNDDNPFDDHGHGTHVAGTVAGNGTSGIKTGIAPDAQIIAIKIAGADGRSGSWSMIIGIQRAIIFGADIINLSFGTSGVGGESQYRQTFEAVLAAGIPAALSAGNDGNKLDSYPIPNNISANGNCPPPYLHPDQKNTLSGGTSAVICVGATDSNDTKAAFSSVGPSTWVGGEYNYYYNDYPYSPNSSTNIGLIRPDVAAPGVSITSLSNSNNTGYRNASGTSMAAPCTSGVMALMLEANPALTPREIDSILEHTATRCEGAVRKNNRTGSGRIDALAAISAVPQSIPIGTGNYSTYNTPFNNFWKNSWNECIYPKESFDSPCKINSISFDCSSAYDYTCSSLKIYMGERSSETHSSNADWTPIEDLQLVYSASNVVIGRNTGWQSFSFDTPFEYSKSGNLVVVVSKTAPSWTCSLQWKSTYVSNSCLFRQSDSDLSYANYPNGSSGTLSNYRANIRLSVTPSNTNYITVGNDDISTFNTPFNNYYKNSWNECIYPKDSFDSPCTINSISYDCSSACSYTCSSLKIYMGERSSATHSSNTDWTPIEDLQLVYSASNVVIGRNTGWQNFTLDTPFEYSKSGNLVIVVAKTAPDYTSTLKWNSTSASNACLYRQSDSDLSYANHPNGSSGSLTRHRANIILSTTPSVYIGNGTVSTYYAPFNNWYKNSWNECIYPKESFDSPCKINSISYDCSSAYAYTCSSLKIYMGERSSATHSSSTDWTPISNLQLVYSASNVVIGSNTGWQKFVLDTPLEYSKSGNLVIVVAKTAPSWYGGLKWNSTSASNSCIYRQDDNNLSYANYPNGSSGTLSNYRANILLKIVSNSTSSNGKSEEIDVIFDEDDSLSEVEMDSDETMSVEETITDNVNIFPNPAQNVINIEMEDNNFEYVIYNELGQVVRQGKSCGKSQINVEDCQKGLYLIKIATEEKTSTHKIVIE